MSHAVYRLIQIKARNHVRIFTPAKIESRFTDANSTAQQLGIYSQRHWTDSIDKMKINYLVDDAAEEFDVAEQTLQSKHNFNNYKAKTH